MAPKTHRNDAPTVPTFELLARACADPERPIDGYGSFNEDPVWVAAIRNASPTRIVKEGLHLKCLWRIREALDDVKRRFEARADQITMMFGSAISGTNMVFLGPPGGAKSLMVRSFAAALGVQAASRSIELETEDIRRRRLEAEAATNPEARKELEAMPPATGGADSSNRRLFEYLVTKYTTPPELVGGVDIPLMLQTGVHARSTVGMLPQAEIVFLDEIFKANSAILNILLAVFNERLFHNMGTAYKVKTFFAVGASNEIPDSKELGALFDRFPVRVPCPPVSDDTLEAVLESAHRHMIGGIDPEARASDRRRFSCSNDFWLVNHALLGGLYGGRAAFPSGSSFGKLFVDLFRRMRSEFGVSDRTGHKMLMLCRALAALDRPHEKGELVDLSPQHLSAWRYVSPTLEGQDSVTRLVDAFVGSTTRP